MRARKCERVNVTLRDPACVRLLCFVQGQQEAEDQNDTQMLAAVCERCDVAIPQGMRA